MTTAGGVPTHTVEPNCPTLFDTLHYELRDGSGAKTVEGLPSYFSTFQRLLGSHTVDVKQGAVITGDIVESLVPGKKQPGARG